MDFSFTEEQELFRKSAREFCDKKVAIRSREIDEIGEIPQEVLEGMASFGLLGITISEKYGGKGVDFTSAAIAAEEIATGKKGGQFYTPRSIVKVLVETIEPYKGRVFDPCCGSGGVFVQSEKFVEAHEGTIGDISIYGQESNQTTWKGQLLREDIRWKFGVPPTGNANFAWVQHFIHHLSPSGIAGFVLANGSMSSDTSGEGEIRKNIIESDLVDYMVALPSQLFYNTMIPACLWFVARDKKNHKFRDRSKEVLFIDARKMGVMVDRRHRELTDEEIKKIASTYHAWRGEGGRYEDVPGFCSSVKLDEIRNHGHILTLGRYVGAREVEEEDEPVKDKISRHKAHLEEQFNESARLEKIIRYNLG